MRAVARDASSRLAMQYRYGASLFSLKYFLRSSILLERETGIEPATFSLGKWLQIENKEHSVYPISFWR
jgi:hypothetical protein